MMKMNVGKICAAAMISALVISSAAGAAVIESADQEVKLEAPDSNWKVVEEEDAKLVVTDGKNKVSVRKYTKEDEIPMPDTADSG